MKVFLMHRDQDFSPKPELRDSMFGAMSSGNVFAVDRARRDLAARQPSTSESGPTRGDAVLAPDLELDTLWSWMAGGDEFLFEMARRTVLSSLRDPEAIVYRQQVLLDCLAQPSTVREVYELALEALASERQLGWLWSGANASYVLSRSVQRLRLYVGVLKRLRALGEEQSDGFRSEGFTRFFAMLREELADEYIETVERHLRGLEFKYGLYESAELGRGDKGKRYIVHEPPQGRGWKERLPVIGTGRPESYSFQLHPRDEAGFRALEEIRGRGINHVADAVAQSADHVQSFFVMLRMELAFYLGCINLHERLAEKGEPICFPEPVADDPLKLTAQGLYDVSLTLHVRDRIVGNELTADGKSMVMITGANQGGKSTLLRSLGLAHLMMQCGMFVGAESFRAGVCRGVFTHYKREEDPTMEGGKLDEELSRMSDIADQIGPRSILLCNESFASTNEREGSEIARQVIRAMLAKGIRVFFVTHMYDLARGFYDQRLPTALFLRAEREPDGRRTFKLRELEPLPTSYGEDSYRRVFSGEASPATVGDARP